MKKLRELLESQHSIPVIIQTILEGFKFYSTQVNLPKEMFEDFWEKIEEEDVYDPKDGDRSYGIEKEPHVTVLYGLVRNVAEEMAEKLKNFGSITLTLNEMSIFENEEYDVLYLKVESEDLVKLNSLFRKEFEYETNFPNYNPHATIGYLKKGKGKKYIDNRSNPLKGVTFEYDAILFSTKESNKIVIPLV